MATVSSIGNRRRSVHWLIIAALAVAFHLLLLLTVKQGFFDVFRKSVDDDLGASSPRSSAPQAILVIPLELESEVGEVVLEAPPEDPSEEPATERRDGEDVEAPDILDVIGKSQAPIPSEPTTRSSIVPPRPVEITWPETEDLGHCLDLYIDIRIRVDSSGEVLRVEPVDADLPPDCTQAALAAARRIKFRPGTADGKPKTMWTDIRIEFRRQRR
jgi:outer membrane biosynthesis protein TonB